MRLGFILFGLFLISFAKVSTFTCDRTQPSQGYCKLVKSGFLWSEEKEMPINQLRGAKFLSNNNSQSPKVVIYTHNDQEVPFSSFASRYDEAQQRAIASQISNFVKNRQQSTLEVEHSDRWWIWVGCISLAVGIFPLLKAKS